MRKIDKTQILSTAYKKWVDKLNRDKKKHPDDRKYYDDIVMNLLCCQEGVCAYTEMPLCNPELFNPDKWKKGRYNLKKPEHFGELDHFDPRLKNDKCWEWDNLFVIESKINKRKGDKPVDDILKPDLPHYNPQELLDYDAELHVFSPHPRIEDNGKKERIKQMIKVLQLNFDFVRTERGKFLKKIFELGKIDQTIKIDRFFTAYQMAAATKEKEE